MFGNNEKDKLQSSFNGGKTLTFSFSKKKKMKF